MPADAECSVRDVEGKWGKVTQKLKTSRLFPKEKTENKDVEHGVFFLHEYLVENSSDCKKCWFKWLIPILLLFISSERNSPILIALLNITEIMEVLKKCTELTIYLFFHKGNCNFLLNSQILIFAIIRNVFPTFSLYQKTYVCIYFMQCILLFLLILAVHVL